MLISQMLVFEITSNIRDAQIEIMSYQQFCQIVTLIESILILTHRMFFSPIHPTYNNIFYPMRLVPKYPHRQQPNISQACSLYLQHAVQHLLHFGRSIYLIQNAKVVKNKYNSMQDKPRTNNKHNGRWTKQEHLNFLQGLRIHGKNWKKIEQLVPSRTGSQIRSHAQKFFIKNKSSHTIDPEEESPLSGELQEYPEEITRSSKSICEASLRRDDHSYYFQQIVKYSSGRNDLNFWQALVDFKEACDISIQQSRKNSFQSLQEQQSSLIQDQFMSKIKV